MIKSKFRIKLMLSALITIAAVFFSGVTVFMFFERSVTADEQGILRVAGWDVYADPEYKNKTIGFRNFEEKFGVQVEFKPLDHLDDIVDFAELHQDYDVFIISNEGIQLLYGMGLVIPLDLERIPHYHDLHHSLRFSEWSLFKSRVNAVPWAWGPTGLLYNVDVLNTPPSSWDVLWDPKYHGHVSLWDDVSMIWTAALTLGYQNVYNLTREQLKNVKEKLLKLNEQAYSYYKGEEQLMEFVIKHKVTVLNSWYDPSFRLRVQGHNFKMVIPEEGAVGMFDSYLISKGAKNQSLAYEFINHQISPLIQQQMVHITGLAPANIETLALLTPNEIKSLHLNEPDYFNRMLLWDQMPRKPLYDDVLKAVREDMESRRK